MTSLPDWQSAVPADCAYPDWLSEQGSLTARLLATGHAFAVELQALEATVPRADEAACLGIASDSVVLVRQVRLTLDGVAVIAARSLSADDGWRAVLDRGGRSLGYSLFGDDNDILRGPLEYATLSAGQALHPGDGPSLFARRSTFARHGERLLVQEVFLPALTGFLP